MYLNIVKFQSKFSKNNIQSKSFYQYDLRNFNNNKNHLFGN